MHILDEMAKALSEGRAEFSAYAPRIEMITIPVTKIRDVIGAGGKVIRGIVEETGAKVDVGDDGVIKIASANLEQIEAAKAKIVGLTAEPEVGAVYDGTVVKVMDFGAFVNFFGPKDGLVHVSQMADYRVHSPSDVVEEGQKVKVLHLGTDDRGRVSLSMKAVDQDTGERRQMPSRPTRPERGGRDRFDRPDRPERRDYSDRPRRDFEGPRRDFDHRPRRDFDRPRRDFDDHSRDFDGPPTDRRDDRDNRRRRPRRGGPRFDD